MSSAIKVVLAQEGKAFKDFLEVPYIVQGDNPVWVPPLRVMQKDLLDYNKNPYFQHAKMKRFVAYKGGKAVGRIAAINDKRHNSIHKENTCIFGHFETIKDLEVAQALFESVEDCAKEWGFDLIRGPFNPNINEDVGTLIDAFDLPPVIMMPYNPPYYPEFLESLGFSKAMDLYAYKVSQEEFSEKTIRGAELIKKRTKLHFRHMTKKTFWDDAFKVWEVYNKAWEDNWCAVPFSEEEFKHLAVNMKSTIDYDLVTFAENDEGKLVGFSLALPDINQAVIKIRNGKLLPLGLPKLMWNTRPGAIDCVRVIIMGVLEEYRGKGVDAVFHYDNLVVGRKKGYKWGEFSWILETNTMMNRVADMVGAKRYKTYRIYDKPIGHLAI